MGPWAGSHTGRFLFQHGQLGMGPKSGSQHVNSEFGVLSLWLRHPSHTTVVAHSAYHSYSVYLYVAGGVQAPRGSQRTWIKVGAAKRTPDTCTQQTPHGKQHRGSARSLCATRRFLQLVRCPKTTRRQRHETCLFVGAYNEV